MMSTLRSKTVGNPLLFAVILVAGVLCLPGSQWRLGMPTQAWAMAPAEARAADIPPGQWLGNPLRWTVEGDALHVLGNGAGTALLESAPLSKRVSVEADVEVAQPVSDKWKVAGVAIHYDAHNYWHFALVMPPEGNASRPSCELCEMRDGHWLAQQNLKRVTHQVTQEAWQLHQTYRLRIALDPEGVEGTLSDRDGRVLRKMRYAFSAAAVTSGRPALRCEGFEATFRRITADHRDPAPSPPPVVFPAYESPSFVQEVKGQRTGYFHMEKQGDIWWPIDPQGRGFVPLGVDHATFRGHGCEKLGYAPYGRKNEAKYAKPELWTDETLGRLRDWGFNLLGAGCARELFHRGLAHTAFAGFGTGMADMGDAFDILPDRHIPCSAFPNVFHPDFPRYCRYQATQFCKPYVGDPWLFGYFLDNELSWWGRSWGQGSGTGLFDAVMSKSATHTAKLALRDFLADRYGRDIVRFNQAWNTKLNTFDEILSRDSISNSTNEAALADKQAFIGLIADRYFRTLTEALRSVDSHHMILGCRFAGGNASAAVWQAAGRYCELLTFNYYGNVDLNQGVARDHFNPRRGKLLGEVFQEFYAWGQRPMMVTEWSFPALDAGLPSLHGAGQRFRTQAERTKATEITARTMLAMPFLVGYDYFMWVDEPAPGISELFPEDSNYGLVNEDGVPYPLLTAALTSVHRDASRLRREGPRLASQAGEQSPPPSPLRKFIEQTATGSQNQPPHSSFRFQRQGEEFIAGNGPWEIRGKVGGQGLTNDVRHRGLRLGRYNAMVQQHAAQHQWLNVDRLIDVRATVGATAMSLDLVGRFDSPAKSERQSFEVAHRITWLPDCDWFVVQVLWCRNTSDRPLDLRGLYFRLESAIGGSGADDLPATTTKVPRLWGAVQGDAWWNEKAAAYWGVAAGPDDPVKIYFWRGDHGSQHPDARIEIAENVATGATYRPAAPGAVLCVAGRGDRQAWQAQAQTLLETIGGK